MNEAALFTLAQQGNATAIAKLCEANMGLVKWVANQFGDKLPFEDRVQEGSIGLLKAIQSFDAAAGFTFATYATKKVKHEIRRAVQKADTVRIPINQQDGRRDLSAAAADFRNMACLDTPVGEDGDATLGDLVGDMDAAFADVDFRMAVSHLSEREADILTLRYMMGETLQEVGDRYGFSRERARQVEAKALGKLNAALTAA